MIGTSTYRSRPVVKVVTTVVSRTYIEPMAHLQPGRRAPTKQPHDSLAARMEPRNSLNALRLLLAILVIISHAPLAGYGEEPYRWGDLEVGGWAVAGFFAISGWLITSSRLRLSFAPFLWRRALRILPGFWMAIFVTAFILAPVSTFYSGVWDFSGALSYVVKNAGLVIFQNDVPVTLAALPFPGNWNLSLWTLSWEFLCYLGVGIAISIPIVRTHRLLTLGAFILLTGMHCLVFFTEQVWATPGMEVGLRLITFFLAGALLFRFGERVSTDWVWPTVSVVVLCVLGWLGWVAVLGGLPLGYLALWAGARIPLQWGTKNDISYGMYIYAFPVQQLLTTAGVAPRGMFVYLAMTLLGTTLLAWASWLIVERPAMRLKKLVR